MCGRGKKGLGLGREDKGVDYFTAGMSDEERVVFEKEYDIFFERSYKLRDKLKKNKENNKLRLVGFLEMAIRSLGGEPCMHYHKLAKVVADFFYSGCENSCVGADSWLDTEYTAKLLDEMQRNIKEQSVKDIYKSPRHLDMFGWSYNICSMKHYADVETRRIELGYQLPGSKKKWLDKEMKNLVKSREIAQEYIAAYNSVLGTTEEKSNKRQRLT